MTSRVIGRLGALALALMLGAGMLASLPAGAAPGFQRPARLINTTRVVGFPQHFVLTAQQAAGRGGNPPGGGFGGSPFPPGGGFGGSSAPKITSQPASESVTAGAGASFSAAASGTPTPTVQWDVSTNGGRSFSAISGATSTTYSVTGTTTTESGNQYEAVFTNSAGHATTNPATLTVNAVSTSAPSITSNPVSESVTAGAGASFSAAASGTPTPTVQWEVSTNGGGSFSTISGATSTTYSVTGTTTTESGNQYEAVFTNSAGHATTNPATLTVNAVSTSAPSITSNPVSESVTAGAGASFSAAASGTPTPTVQWEVSTNGGGSFSTISGATSTTYSVTGTTTTESGNQYEAVFTNSAGHATTNPATLTVTAAAPPPPSSEQSTNWSGYADVGTTFSAVSASWTVPTITCSGGGTQYSAHWIGIDGYTSSTVEQDGTEADCSNGQASYDAWYELYGDSAVNSGDEVELNPSSYPVSHGDTISASVSVVGSAWTLTVDDSSRGWSYSADVNFTGAAQSSAEWVVERPEVCSFRCSLTSLADFGTVTFSSASATSGGSSASISGYSDASIEMVSGSTVLAVPSALTANGAGFTDTWKAA